MAKEIGLDWADWKTVQAAKGFPYDSDALAGGGFLVVGYSAATDTLYTSKVTAAPDITDYNTNYAAGANKDTGMHMREQNLDSNGRIRNSAHLLGSDDGGTTLRTLKTAVDGTLLIQNTTPTDKVAVDGDATGDFLGATSGDGVLRTSSPLTYADGGDFITLGVDQSAIDHVNLANIGTNTHAQIDTHIADMANPHSVDIDDVTPTTTKGDIIVENGTNAVRLPVGTDGQVLTADSAEATGVKWGSGNTVFGNGYEQAESDGESTTTSSTYQTKLSHTTAALAAGNYKISFYFELKNSTNESAAQALVEVGSTEIANPYVYTKDDTSTYWSCGGYRFLNLSGAQTITIKYREQSGGTARIRKARIEIFRVS